MNRNRLPNRRPNITAETDWQGHSITVTIGVDPVTGDPLEVFANAASGGSMQASLADACVLISIALQHGVKPAALAKSLARVPAWVNGIDENGDPCTVETTAPASPVGAILAEVVGME